MSRALLAALLALLALSAGVVVPTSAPGVTSAPSDEPRSASPAGSLPAAAPNAARPLAGHENTTDVLLLNRTERSEFVATDVDLSTALSIQRDGLGGRLSAYALERNVSGLNATARRDALLAALDRAQRRVDALRATQNRVRGAYVNGTTTATRYLQTLAVLDSRAGEVARFLVTVRTLAAETENVSMRQTDRIPARLSYLRMQLALVQGPVRDRVAKVLQGNASETRVFVAASANGSTLTMIRDGTYVHEATRLDRFDGAAFNASRDIAAAFNHSFDLYPWATNDSAPLVSSLGTDVYRVKVPHPQSRTIAYFDGSSGPVFREVQYKNVSRLPATSNVTRVRDGVVLRATPVYPGGPMKVTLETTNGEPLKGDIRIGGTYVGTSTNGTLWTLGGQGEFVVTADVGDTQIPLIVRARDPSGNDT